MKVMKSYASDTLRGCDPSSGNHGSICGSGVRFIAAFFRVGEANALEHQQERNSFRQSIADATASQNAANCRFGDTETSIHMPN
jgi:hypothetical protein